MLKERSSEADRMFDEIPADYEVLDAQALADRLGFKRDTILSYVSLGSFHRIPRPSRRLATGPIWYEVSVRNWEQTDQHQRKRGRKPNSAKQPA